MRISLSTYRISPFVRVGEPIEPLYKPGSEWARDAVKGLMHLNSDLLKEKRVDTSLFHNHDELTSKTKPGYPLIIYHYNGGQFLVTGINEGAYAMDQLMALYHGPVVASSRLIVGFSAQPPVVHEIEQKDHPQCYNLYNYLALNSKIHKEFEQANAMQRIVMLEDAIAKHLEKDLFKYLNIELPTPQPILLDLPIIHSALHTYKNHQYLSFNLKFSVNISLPNYLPLGNGKAMGFGILEKYSDAV